MDRALRQLAGSATHPGREAYPEIRISSPCSTIQPDQSGQVAPMGLRTSGRWLAIARPGSGQPGFRAPGVLAGFIEQRILPDLQGKTRKLSNNDFPATCRCTPLVAQANQLNLPEPPEQRLGPGTTMTAALRLAAGRRWPTWATAARTCGAAASFSRLRVTIRWWPAWCRRARSRRRRCIPIRSATRFTAPGDRPEVEVDLFHVSLQKGTGCCFA